jgi:hypothetical protein
VALGHLRHQRRLVGLGGVDVGQRLGIGEVHIVIAREARRLARRGRVVATAAAVVGLDVLPQGDAEGLDVGRLRRRSGVIVHLRRIGIGIDRGRRTAATGGKTGQTRRNQDDPEHLHEFLPDQPRQ